MTQTTADPGLLRIVARAHDIQARLMQNTDLTVHVIALCVPKTYTRTQW
jgi:hypothetical protein